MPKFILNLSALLFLFAWQSPAQSAQWGWTGGGGFPNDDGAHTCKVASNGDIVVAGAFEGTVDLDPSAAIYNITSNGATDMFIARYSSAGIFLWGFNLGGNNRDAIYGLDFDSQGNILVDGYFRGTVDMNPSAGVSNIYNNTTQSYSQQWGGDMFLAKYSPTGVYIWAFGAGGWTAFDNWSGLSVDGDDNIYVGGVFVDLVDIDPSVNVVNLNSNTGKLMIVKYSPSGQLIWGKNFSSPGGAAVNTDIRAMVVKGGYIYFDGFFMNTADFDPSPNTANFTANGVYDAYVSKFDTAGNYVWVVPISGAGLEDALDLRLDASNNIYITGYTQSNSLDFSPFVSSNVTAQVSAGGNDIMIAKYNDAGVYLWGKIIGNTGFDRGWDLELANNKIYLTGQFGTTVDFDPSVGVSNLTASGNTDIFLAQYDLNGNYICAFNVGGSANLTESGYKVASNTNGDIFLSGVYGGTNVDFDPSAGTLLRSSLNNNYDAFLMKYVYAGSNNLFTVTTDTICSTETAYLTFTDTAGAGPFTITLSDGSNSYVYTNIQSGVAFPMNPSPVTTTTYTWSITGGGQSACFSTTNSGSFTVVVNPSPTANAGPDISECNSSFVQLNGSGGGGNYTWTPAVVLNNPNISNPTLTVTDTTITFTLVTTNVQGCSDTDQVVVSVHTGIAMANAGSDSSVCPGNPIQLQGNGNGSFQWYPPAGLSNPGIANPIYTGSNTTTFSLVVTDQFNCKDTDQVVINMLPVPIADAGTDVQACAGDAVQLQGTGGGSYNWYPNSGMTGSNTATPTVTVSSSTIYYVVTTNTEGCSDTDAVVVSAVSVPMPVVSPPQRVCNLDSVTIYVSGGSNYSWYPDDNISSTTGDTIVVWPGNSTTYYVVVTEPLCGYIDTLAIDIEVKPRPNVQIDKAEAIHCSNPYGQLAASGAKNYVWTPANTLNDPAIAAPLSFAKQPTWYTVMGISTDGCVGYDSALVDVISDNMDGFFLPTVFSPNEDGKNDCYRILLPPGISEYELHIYNRWGNNVFNADDPSDCWDGTYNGEPCDVGVYMYYYVLKSPVCGVKKEGKGDITLLR